MDKERAEVPVVTIYHERLRALVGRRKSLAKILEALPYIGLDIEDEGSDHVRVEYNPDRPDFSTDYGIARALRGIMNLEVGLPRFRCGRGQVSIRVDPSVGRVRPYIVSLVALGGRLDGEGIRQVIAMQEDIHEGIGRKRKKVSIGIHNRDVVSPPLLYTTRKPDFRFVPLNSDRSMSMQEILEQTDVGRDYGRILEGRKRLPVILDSEGNVLSFPPVINSALTRVTKQTKNLLIDVTATEMRAAEDALAIVAMTLFDAGFRLESVGLNYGRRHLETPDMRVSRRSIENKYVNKLLGLEMGAADIVRCLKRCRIGATAAKSGGRINCHIPRYRLDVMHDVDVIEEIAIGYGVNRMKPSLPRMAAAGSKEPTLKILDETRQVLVGLGLLEVVNFSLVSRKVQYDMTGRKQQEAGGILAVEETKSMEHEVLRDSIIPSLMLTLSRNIHEPYPQRIFEVGKTFSSDNGVQERWAIATAIAHRESGYTEAKSYLQALLRTLFGIDVETRAISHPMLEDGRAAEVTAKKTMIGIVGEVKQKTIDNFRLRVPVSVSEVYISGLIET